MLAIHKDNVTSPVQAQIRKATLSRAGKTSGNFSMQPLESRLLFSAIVADSGAVLGLLRSTSILPAPNATGSLVAIGKKGYLYGQQVAAFYISGQNVKPTKDVLYIYDSAARTWHQQSFPDLKSSITGVDVGKKAVFAARYHAEQLLVLDTTSGHAKSIRTPFQFGTAGLVGVGNHVIAFLDINTANPRVLDYNFSSHKWTELQSIANLITTSGFGIIGHNLVFTPKSENTVVLKYNVDTTAWTSTPLSGGIPGLVTYGGGLSVGTKLVQREIDGYHVFDTVNNQSTFIPQPQTFALLGSRLISVGSKVIFNSGTPSMTTTGQSYAEVFDVATNQLVTTAAIAPQGSTTAPQDGVSATVGTQGIFAGGVQYPSAGGGAGYGFDLVTVFTDTTPLPEISGNLTGRPGHAVTLQLFNTGDAPLASGTAVKIYATLTRGVIDGTSTLLGTQSLRTPLAATDNRTLRLRTNLPGTLAAGDYSLVAAVDDGRTVTPVASSDTPFKIAAKATPAVRHAIAGAFTRLFRR